MLQEGYDGHAALSSMLLTTPVLQRGMGHHPFHTPSRLDATHMCCWEACWMREMICDPSHSAAQELSAAMTLLWQMSLITPQCTYNTATRVSERALLPGRSPQLAQRPKHPRRPPVAAVETGLQLPSGACWPAGAARAAAATAAALLSRPLCALTGLSTLPSEPAHRRAAQSWQL